MMIRKNGVLISGTADFVGSVKDLKEADSTIVSKLNNRIDGLVVKF